MILALLVQGPDIFTAHYAFLLGDPLQENYHHYAPCCVSMTEPLNSAYAITHTRVARNPTQEDTEHVIRILDEVRDAMIEGDRCMDWMLVSVMMMEHDDVVPDAMMDVLSAELEPVGV